MIKISELTAADNMRLVYNINHDEFLLYNHNLGRFFRVGSVSGEISFPIDSFDPDMFIAVVPGVIKNGN